MRLGSLVLCVVCLLGCGGGGGNDGGAVSGTLGSTSYVASGAIAFRPAIDTCVAPEATETVLALFVTFSSSFDTTFLQGNTCSQKASSRNVGLAIWRLANSGDIAPGTYPSGSTSGGAYWWDLDASCQRTGENQLLSDGTVTIETSDSTHVVGRLNVSSAGGDRLAGRFDAPVVESPYSVCQLFGFTGGTPGPGCSAPVCVP